jgi:hypothetical protein
VPSVGVCAARTNEGDFVRIAPTAGAQLRNMQYAWRCPIPLEKAAAQDPHMQGTTSFEQELVARLAELQSELGKLGTGRG